MVFRSMGSKLRAWVAARDGLRLDGAMGTLVGEAGVDLGTPLWASAALLSDAGIALTTALHVAYLEAGAELLTANVHNASEAYVRRWLEQGGEVPAGLPDEARELTRSLNQRGIEAARDALRTHASSPALVAGCLASPDVPYASSPSLDPEAVARGLATQLEMLCELQPDLLLFEMCTTESDLEGLRIALERVGPHPEVGVGLVLGEHGRLLGGPSLEEALARLTPVAPSAVFIHCTAWHAVLEPLERLVAAAGDAVPGVYANDGRRYVDGRFVGERVDPQRYAEAARRWRDAGARIIGGCCGTTPEHIRALGHR